ncbi:MAG: hypothetical protein KC731_04805, partial [Myxococcales bacterium]|nr:hypothetical protein [Myxococcales bacterium]
MSLLARLKEKNFDRWATDYARHVVRSAARPRHHGVRHVLFALCDHYEPLWTTTDEDLGEARVRKWVEEYPTGVGTFRDADGRPPQHSFFFPGEEYRPRFFDQLDRLVEGGFGEVELHLHHDGATVESMRRDVLDYLAIYAERGHLSRDPDGRLRYAFIHGNW